MLRARRWVVSSFLFVVVAASCAPTATGGGSRSPNVITREDIEGTNYSTAYEVVRRFRPQWLRARSAPSFGGEFEVMVYLDNVRFGEVGSLSSIPAQNLERVEWVDAGTATQRWGTGNAGGAIAVVTRR